MKIKKFKIKKIWIILSAISAVMIAVYFILTAISSGIAGSLKEQNIASKWSPDSSQYSQTSCFISSQYGFNKDSVLQIRHAVNNSLEESSIKTDDEHPDSRLWIDAYSAESRISISVHKNEVPLEVNAVFCGGDFFYFHEFDYKSGYCFSENDLNADRVVIDENIAWQLYGSYEINGMEININGSTFIIAGVIERSSDKVSELTYGSKNRMYIPYSAYEKIFPSGVSDESALNITCYEAVLPSPVSHFGYKILSEQFPKESLQVSLIENSSRFSDSSLFEVLKSYGKRSIITNDIIYPYWENSARVTEDKLALILFFRIPLLIIPIIYAVVAAIIFWKKHGIKLKDCKAFVDKLIDNHRKKIYYGKKEI